MDLLRAFLLVLTSSCAALAHLRVDCPPQESIAPCSCSAYSTGISIRCERVNSFQDILKALKGYKVNYLQVIGLNTSMSSSGLFQGLHIRHLQLYEMLADKDSLGHSHFLGLENSLEVLEIYFDPEVTSSLSSVELDHLHSLRTLEFFDLGTSEFGNEWFKGPENFDYFKASFGRLEKLGDKAFASQLNLRFLKLSNNELKEISRSMFPYPANRLQSLDLASNKIRTLPNDVFSGMPALKEVLLRKNLIQTLPQDTWSPIFYKLRTQGAFIGNPLRCDEDLRWACEVNPNELGGAKCASPDDMRGLYVGKFCEAWITNFSTGIKSVL